MKLIIVTHDEMFFNFAILFLDITVGFIQKVCGRVQNFLILIFVIFFCTLLRHSICSFVVELSLQYEYTRISDILYKIS